MKNYRRMSDHAKIAGVCSGLAYYLNIQTWIVRLVLLFLVFGAGFGILTYLLIALLAPKYDSDPSDYAEICE